MSHVDDGDLHAFLDGALEALAAEEARRIREHLAACPACAVRLEEAREARSEASRILEGAAPTLDGLPSFEELRSQAAARGRPGTQGRAGRVQRMAWAASVVLALGAGWMLRAATAPGAPLQRALQEAPGDGPVTPSRPDRARNESSPLESDALAPSLSPGEPPTEAEAEPADDRSLEASEQVTVRAVDTDVARGGLAAEAKVTLPRLERPRSADVTAASLTVRTDSAGGRPDDLLASRDSVRGAQARAASEARRATAPEQLSEPRPAVLDAAVARRSMASPAAVAQPGRDLDPKASLVVPGLQVLSVTWLDENGLVGVVRVRQLLEGGDTLELLHLPPGFGPTELGVDSTDGRTELVVPREEGWLVARARTTSDRLRELVDRLLSMP